MEEVGIISGEVKPTKFKIRLKDASVERGSYVKIKHDVYGWVLARVESLKRYLDDFEDELNEGTAHTIGYKKDDDILVPKTPFKPSEKVYRADNRLITSIVGLRAGREGNIYLGVLEGHSIPVYMDSGKFIGKHVSVLAKTGAGKSYTVAVILEELLKTGMPIVVIDPHGEYNTLAVENDDYDTMVKYNERLGKGGKGVVKAASYAGKVVEYVANPHVNQDAQRLILKPEFDVEELCDIMPMSLGDKQKSILYEALKELEGTNYSLNDIIDVVEREPTRVKWKLVSGLETLSESGVFSGEPINYEELVQKGRVSVVNLAGVTPRIQELLVAKLARDLFDQRRMGRLPELFFLIEEAHNFCPERGFGDTLSSGILRNIASEGRKFGFKLGVVSQRPARIDKNVLSQCNTQVILKVTNPNDLRAISQSIEGFTSGMEGEIRELPVGHAMVVGECVEQPISVVVRARETKHGTSLTHDWGKKEEKPAEEGEEADGEGEPGARESLIARLLRKIFLKDEAKTAAEEEE